MMRRAARFVLPALSIVVLLAAWHYAIIVFDVSNYLVPPPEAVLAELVDGLLVDGNLWPQIETTVIEIAIGYAAGCAAGLLFAALISQFELLEWALYPLMAGIQSIPKVALAPVLMVWFGFDIQSKVILVGLICFFPTFVNAFAGLRTYDSNLRDLYQAFGATRWRVFWAVKVPSAAGQIFVGLEVSVVLALIGAVLAELLSSRSGLGHVIAAAGANFNVALMFACSLLLAVIGTILTELVRGIHRKVTFWEKKAAAGASTAAY